MRCVALGEELRRRGHDVDFFLDSSGVSWLGAELSSRGLGVRPPVETAEECRAAFASRYDAVVFDSYLLPTEVYLATRSVVALTVAVVDSDLRGARADVYLDQNVGAECEDVALPPGAVRLAGLDYALIRRDIAQARPEHLEFRDVAAAPRVLVVLGGTDALGLAPRLTADLLSTGRAMHVDVIAARQELADRIDALVPGAGQHIEVHRPRRDLQTLVLASDLVIGATGSATWELLTLGACAAVICVADNQEPSYTRLVAMGVVAGLGHAHDGSDNDASHRVEVLSRLLDDPAERARQARAGWELVDSKGAARVADAIEQRLPG
jgi:spore coat polysaccharide biosynthesis predicted glycosyltransferase SpsG